MLYQLFEGREVAQQSRETPVANRAIVPPLKPVYSRGLVRQFFAWCLVVAMLGLFISITVFLFYPRSIKGGLLSGIMPSSRRSMAFDETVDLYGNLNVTASTSRVFRVQIEDQAGNPMRMRMPLRFRASVFDVYEDGLWLSTGAAYSENITLEPDRYEDLAVISGPSEYVTQRFLLNLRMRPLPCLYAPFALRASDSLTLRYQPDNQTLRLSPVSQRLVEYEVQSVQNPSDTLGAELMASEGPSLTPDYLGLDPRIQELAYALLDEAGVQRQPPVSIEDRWRWCTTVADVFLRELNSSEYKYLLDMRRAITPDGLGQFGDPASWFLFESKQGHCQFFATAMALLCQSVGVEARIVTGFLCVLYDDEIEEYAVLAQNAHAWTEVRTGDYEWETYDATPSAALNEIYVRDPSMIDNLRWLYEDLEDGWSASVLEFDSASQQQITQRLQFDLWGFLSLTWDQIAAWARGVNRAFRFGVSGYIWLGIVAAGIVVAIIVLFQLLHRRGRTHDVMQLKGCSTTQRRLLRKDAYFYVEMLGLLSKYGFGKPQWQSPLAFANHIPEQHESIAGLVKSLTQRYYAIRFGDQRPSDKDREHSKKQMVQLRLALEATQ